MENLFSTQVAIIGAGPTGLELAVALKRAGIAHLIFDAGQIGHTLTWWPRNTHFYSTSERIAISGMPLQVHDQQHPTGEQYLAYLRGVVESVDLQVNTFEPVTRIFKLDEGFLVVTETIRGTHRYTVQQVVLATGGMAGPRLLDIPGEDYPHVSHYLDDPHFYFRKDLLVVGGRNSAVEYALRCWRAGARVTLSYRKPELPKASIKPALMQDIETVVRDGKIRFLPATMPVEITPFEVILAPTDENGQPTKDETTSLPFDFVLVCSGYVADMGLFEQLEVTLQGEEQVPVYNPDTMETDVPGVYVLGTAVGGTQKKFSLFIETSHVHVSRILAALQASGS
ncbi:MAG: pyridine nucleotide-disulfide oxidoreductase [Chloroflexi bacterium HGW-Chloroflexi-10]|nr:MAG: pyridine nucleotide-disulfide oxidoreductase [Chloroflexi bacterium HGW-Chloroflexi-10]